VAKLSAFNDGALATHFKINREARPGHRTFQKKIEGTTPQLTGKYAPAR